MSPVPSAFVKCPCCCGHEVISEGAALALALMIGKADLGYTPVAAELENIRNSILNFRQHEQREEWKPPPCPTPAKRKYSNHAHALPYATKWSQHAYECECGYWHLSKQTPADHKAKVNAPPAGADEFDDVDPLLT